MICISMMNHLVLNEEIIWKKTEIGYIKKGHFQWANSFGLLGAKPQHQEMFPFP